MKGQVSIEFISLLSLALLASAILVTSMSDRAIEYSRSSPYYDAQDIAQKVAYKVDYVISEKNTSLDLEFSPRITEEYNITIGSGQVLVNFDTGDSSFPTRYNGTDIELKTNQSYTISYQGGLVVN